LVTVEAFPTKFVEVTLVSPDKVVLLPPKAITVDPIVTELLESLAFAIEPANMALVTVPESPDVITVPVVAGNVIVVVPATAAGCNVTVPEVDPEKAVLVSPDKVVLVPPKAIAVDPIVTELLESLAFAIEPANMTLVTVPESPDVITVPVVAGSVIVVVPATAAACNVTVPEVDPEKAVLVSPDKVVLVPPRETTVDPIVTELLESLAFAIEPANMVLVTVPVSLDVITVPSTFGIVNTRVVLGEMLAS